MARHVVFWSVAVFVFLLDRLTKELVRWHLDLHSSIDFSFFSIVHVKNTGTAFGFLPGASWLFVLLAFAVSIYIMWSYASFDPVVQPILALVLAGALGNLFDRIFYEGVIDFFDLGFWPAFNVADSAIVVAIVLLMILNWKGRIE